MNGLLLWLAHFPSSARRMEALTCSSRHFTSPVQGKLYMIDPRKYLGAAREAVEALFRRY